MRGQSVSYPELHPSDNAGVRQVDCYHFNALLICFTEKEVPECGIRHHRDFPVALLVPADLSLVKLEVLDHYRDQIAFRIVHN